MKKLEDEKSPVWSYQSPKLNKQVVEILKFNFSESSARVSAVKTRNYCVLTCKNAEHVRRGRRTDVRAWGLSQPGDRQGIPWGKNGEELPGDDRTQNHIWPLGFGNIGWEHLWQVKYYLAITTSSSAILSNSCNLWLWGPSWHPGFLSWDIKLIFPTNIIKGKRVRAIKRNTFIINY